MKNATLSKAIVSLFLLFVLGVSPLMALGSRTGTKTPPSQLTASPRNPAGPALTADDPPIEKKAAINPGKIEQGLVDLPIQIIFFECQKAWNGKVFKIEDKSLISDGIRINDLKPIIAETDGGKCYAYGSISVTRVTPAAKYQFKVSIVEVADSTQEISLQVTGPVGLQPGPIPTEKPEVDVMWSVVPKGIVADNFGPKIAKRFYCLEVVIGNNSGFDLQIAAVGFKSGPLGPYATVMAESHKYMAENQRLTMLSVETRLKNAVDSCKSDKKNRSYAQCVKEETEPILEKMSADSAADLQAMEKLSKINTDASRQAYGGTIPVTSYPMARGTASHGEFWSIRNITVRLLAALGPIAIGFTPFLNVKNQNNYSNAVNLFTNPISEGFANFVPDEFVPQLQRLDDQILRDGMIITNNRQVRTRTFIPKKLLRIDKKYINDPMVVTQALGEIVLIGNLINYLNRVSVTSKPSGEVAPPPVFDNEEPIEFNAGEENGALLITGTGLEGARISSPDADIEVLQPTQATKTSASTKIRVKPDARRGDHLLKLDAPGGSKQIKIIVIPQGPTITEPPKLSSGGEFKNPVSLKTEEQVFKMELKGKGLLDTTLEPMIESEGVITVDGFQNSGDGILTANVRVPPGTKAGNYRFRFEKADVDPARLREAPITIKVEKGEAPKDLAIKFTGGDPVVNPLNDATYNFTMTGKNIAFLLNYEAPAGEAVTPEIIADKTRLPDGSLTGKIRIPKELRVDDGTSKEFVFKIFNLDGVSGDLKIPVKAQPKIEVTAPTAEQTVGLKFLITGNNMEGIEVEDIPDNWEVEFDRATAKKKSISITIRAQPGTTPTIPEGGIPIVFKNANTKLDQPVKIKLKPAP